MGVNPIKKWFTKKSNLNIEQELTKEVIEHNTSEEVVNVSAKIIQYYVNVDSEETDIPTIIFICDFHSSIMPDIGSIIWCPNKDKNKLEPYKVNRFDFIEDIDNNSNLYIVVNEANIQDITKYNVYD